MGSGVEIPNPGTMISGLGGAVRDIFRGASKVIKTPTEKPKPQDIAPHYKFSEAIDKRLCGFADYFYREGSFEKIQFARKWMRNSLIFQGYHELEWSEINVAWDIIQQDSGDYAFPNNYYRTLILHGVRAYLKNEPIIDPVPSNDDAAAQAATKAARTALEIIKKSVKYDYLRVIEAINLRLYGNSFRFSYYSKDPRYGYATAPVYEDTNVLLSPGGSMCPVDGPMEGQFPVCPACGSPTTPLPPLMANLPLTTGSVKYPKGDVMTEVVNPLEIYLRSSSYDLWHAPFVVRNRMVDRIALQSAYPDIQLNPKGDEGGGEAYATGGDLGLIYLQSLADLPGDPTQYAAWYERASAAAKALLVEAWIRPSQYFFDKELLKKFPDGLYIAKSGDILLEARNDTIEDHWTHYVFTPVPGRIWGDGDDDLIPGTLKLDETDRLILRNQGYNSAPLLAIDSQRMDKNTIVNDPSTILEVKSAGKPVREAFEVIPSQPLSQESWNWRNAHIADMGFHSRISPAAVGQHEKGVNTFGGQESAAAKSEESLLPNLMLWKTADECWARQVLKLAANNWLDNRVHSVMGLNGRWEFEKLRGTAIDLDKVTIVTRVLPIDPSQQDSMSQAVASGLLDPQDPRVKRKAMELFHLPTELDAAYMDQKAQWREIEQMKQGQQPQPMLIRDNDAVHIDICRVYLNSDDAQSDPQTAQRVLLHAQMHMMNMLRQQQMAAAIQGAGMEVQNATNPQPQQPAGGPQKGGPRKPGESGGEQKAQGGKKGGQVPKNPVTRQQRSTKANQAAANRPQPPSGNQHGIRRAT